MTYCYACSYLVGYIASIVTINLINQPLCTLIYVVEVAYTEVCFLVSDYFYVLTCVLWGGSHRLVG